MKKTAKAMNLLMPGIVAGICAAIMLAALALYGDDSKMLLRILMAFGLGWGVGSLVEYVTMRAAGGPGYKEWK